MNTSDGSSAGTMVRRWAPVVSCALAGAVVFQFFGNANRGYVATASLFYWWGFQWFNADSETQHGLLILALSGWLFARNLRDEKNRLAHDGLKAQPQAGSDWGVGAMLAGLALHAVGFAAQQARVSIVALLLFMWGVIVFAGVSAAGAGQNDGRRWGRAAAFPLGFMIFAVPVNVLDSVGFWLRLWVLDATEVIARIGGIGLGRSGTQLFASNGSYQYDVAAACSGVRSLMALAALTLLLGYLNFRGWGRRLAILALCFPLTYIGNVVRIVAIVFAGEWFGQRAGERVHEWAGFLVFVIVLGGALAVVRLWQRFRPEADCHLLSDIPFSGGRRRSGNWSSVAAVVVILAAGVEMGFLGWLRGLPPRGEAGVQLAADGVNPMELPTFLGRQWIGAETPVTKVEREILPADTGFSRKLYSAVGDPARQVFVSVVLSGRDRTSIHRPELCLVGQGLTIESTTQRTLTFPGDSSATFSVTVLRGHREAVTSGGDRVNATELVVYWFVGGDTVEATQARRLARDAWNRVVHARADRWAYVLVETNAADGEAAALARVQAVIGGVWPALQKPQPRR